MYDLVHFFAKRSGLLPRLLRMTDQVSDAIRMARAKLRSLNSRKLAVVTRRASHAATSQLDILDVLDGKTREVDLVVVGDNIFQRL